MNSERKEYRRGNVSRKFVKLDWTSKGGRRRIKAETYIRHLIVDCIAAGGQDLINLGLETRVRIRQGVTDPVAMDMVMFLARNSNARKLLLTKCD